MKSRKLKRRSKSVSWKNLKIVNRVKRLIRLSVISVFAIVVAILLLWGISLYKFMKAPFASSGYNLVSSEIKENTPISLSFIVLEDKDDPVSKIVSLYFVAIDISNLKMDIFEAPPDLTLDLPQRYGKGKVEKVYALGEFSKKGGGIVLANKLLEKIFAKRIDKYVVADLETLKKVNNSYNISSAQDLDLLVSIKNIPKLFNLLGPIHEGFETNLTLNDLIVLTPFIRKIPDGSVKVDKVTLNDLSNSFAFDEKISDFFLDSGVVSLHKRIVVLNGTNSPGLSSFAARFIRNFGGTVASTDNSSVNYDKSVVVADDLTSDTLKRVVYELGITNVVRQDEAGDLSKEDVISADITVILGIDYAASL